MDKPTSQRTLYYNRVVVCGHCQGGGTIVTEEPDGHNHHQQIEIICDICRGGGMLTIKKTINIEIYPKHAKNIDYE